MRFIDLAPGDRFTALDIPNHQLLTKINERQARAHSWHSIANEQSCNNDPIIEVDQGTVVVFVPVRVRIA